MNLRSFILALIMLLLGNQYLSAGTIYETITLNDNGSGTIKLNYNNVGSVLKENKFVLGNLPFSDKIAEGFFNSKYSTVKKAKLDFDAGQDKYFMTIELEFTDINKLNEAKGFSNIRTAWYNTDTGTVFTYTIAANPDMAKYFESQTYVVNFRSPIKKTNGTIKSTTVTWPNVTPQNSDINLTANVKTVNPPKTTPTTSKPNTTSTPNKSSGETKENKEGSCGLFGMELPLILLGGYVVRARLIRKSN